MRFKSEHKIGTFQRHTAVWFLPTCIEAQFSTLYLQQLHQQQTINCNKAFAVGFQIWESKGRECQLFSTIQFQAERADKSNGLSLERKGRVSTDPSQGMNNWGNRIFTWAGRAEVAHWVFKPFGNQL